MDIRNSAMMLNEEKNQELLNQPVKDESGMSLPQISVVTKAMIDDYENSLAETIWEVFEKKKLMEKK